MYNHFLMIPIYAVASECSCFNIWLPKRKMKTTKGRGCGLFKSPGSHISWRVKGLQQWWEALQQWPPASLHLCDEQWPSVIRAQIPPHLEDRVLFVPSGCCKLCASCSRNTCTAACHTAGDREWVAATGVRAEMDQNSPSKPSPGSCKPYTIDSRVPK